jgi:hypothetical protein
MTIDSFCGYPIADLHAAFSAVCNQDNWKYPIDASVPADKLAITLVAIPFMCGGQCTVTPDADGTFHVANAGYYANIGA